MKFGPVSIERARGAMLAHSIVVGGQRVRKSHVVTAKDVETFRAAGISEVVVAILEAGDVEENEAATRIAAALRFEGAFARPAATGRVNIFAAHDGVFTADKALIDAINAVDPAATAATLASHVHVAAGQMIATIKIIPFAIQTHVVEAIARVAADRTTFAVHAYRPCRVGLVQTVLPGVKDSVLDKTARITAERLLRSGSTLSRELRTLHEVADVAAAIEDLASYSEMVIAFGASAISDPEDDVIPAAIRASGGKVLRSGMPVDPGNLLVLGERHGRPILGAPGCARSPRPNGFDWVLDRILAGIAVTSEDIAAMGVGGLLTEIPSRPQPREPLNISPYPRVHAVVLAAGRSTRMGRTNKLLALFEGEPLVRRTASRVAASRTAGVILVTGHQHDLVKEALQGIDLTLVHNPDFTEGLSSSLKAGIAAIPPTADGVIIVLADMPAIASADIDRLIDVFRASGGTSVVRAAFEGKRGNPVILPRSLFAGIAELQGDTGARHLVESGKVDVIDVDVGCGAVIDVDTRDALANAGGVVQTGPDREPSIELSARRPSRSKERLK